MNNKKYLLIDIFAKLNGKNAILAYRMKKLNLSSCDVSFYLAKIIDGKYLYYKIAEKKYDDCCFDVITDILKEKGYKNIEEIEKQKGAKRKRLLYK